MTQSPTNPAAGDGPEHTPAARSVGGAGEALLPCPFCGSGDAFAEQSTFASSYVICNDCSARGPDSTQESDDEDEPGRDAATTAWNTRLAQFQSSDVEAVREACARIADSENEAAKIALREPCTDIVERAYRRGRGEAGVAIGVGIRNLALPTPTTDAARRAALEEAAKVAEAKATAAEKLAAESNSRMYAAELRVAAGFYRSVANDIRALAAGDAA